MEKLTSQEVALYQNITNKIERLVKKFYYNHISNHITDDWYCWELLDTGDIQITYSSMDYHEEKYYNNLTLTIDKLNNN